jgi:hypothetical protein
MRARLLSREVLMRSMWSLGILLALMGCVSAGGSPGYGIYTYSDVLRPHGRVRGEAAEQAATRVCDAGISDRIGTPKFDACMRGRGWRLANFQPAPQQYSPSPSYDAGSSAASSSGPDPSQAANDAMAASQANIAAQQQNDAANAATQQTEYNFNIMYNPQQN